MWSHLDDCRAPVRWRPNAFFGRDRVFGAGKMSFTGLFSWQLVPATAKCEMGMTTRRKFLTLSGWPIVMAGLTLLVACSGDTPESLLASARAKLDKGEAQSALIDAKNALQKNPESGPARLMLGRALLEAGDVAGAELELGRAQAQKVSPDETLPPLLRVYLAQGKFAKVVEQGMNTPLQSNEAIADAMTSVAVAELSQRRGQAAEEALSAALRANAEFIPALLLKARLLAGARDFPGATTIVDSVLSKQPTQVESLRLRADLLAAQGQSEASIAAYRKVLEVRPGLVAAHAALLQSLLRERKIDDAGKAFEAMKKAAPKHPQSLYFEAQLAILRKDFKAAREASQSLVRATPENPAALTQSGIIDFNLRALAQAEASLSKAVQLAPGAAVARRWLAMTHLAQGQAGKAIAVLEPVLARADVDGNLLMVAGQAYMQSGDTKRAEEYLARAVKAQPDDPRRRTALAMTRMGRGEGEAALADLEQISASDQGTTADLALIATHLRRGEFDRALAAIDVLGKKQADKALPHDLRGRVHLAKKDNVAARASFERALALEPTYFQSTANLAALDLADKRPGDAIARFEKLVNLDAKNVRAWLAIAEIKAGSQAPADEVLALLAKAIAAGPTDPAPRSALVAYHLRAKDAKKAVAAAQDAVGAIPDRPEVLDLLGRAQMAAGDHRQASATFAKMAGMAPNSPEPHLRMAEAQIADKNPSGAAQSLRKALELRPDLLAARRGLAAISMADGKPQDAVALARQLQQSKPDNAAGYLLEGDIHASRRAWPEAIEAYRKGLKQAKSTELAVKLHAALVAAAKPGDAGAFAASWLKEQPRDDAFRMHLGDFAVARKEYAQAASHYRTVLQSRPEDAVVLNNLAWSLGRLKDPTALATAEKALSLAPGQPAILDTVAVIAAEKGDVARSLELFAKALHAAPEAHGIRLNFARALAQAGKRNEAKKELDELARLGDKFAEQAEVAQLLKSL